MPLKLDLTAAQDPLALRRDAYPDAGEQIGALIKFVKAILPHLPAKALADMPPEIEAIVAAVDEVKTTFLKPEKPDHA